MTKATIETAMKVAAPPGRPVHDGRQRRARSRTAVSAQAMPVAAPMISRIAPDSDAVSTSIGMSRRQSNCAIDQEAGR